MGELAAVLEPDIALITNIGTAHIGILGSRDAIAEEKKKIFSRFDGRQAGFVWEDDDYHAFLKEGVRGDVARFRPEEHRRAARPARPGASTATSSSGTGASFPLRPARDGTISSTR